MERTDFQGWILSLINKTLLTNRQHSYKITQQSDKIIVWLVGFSLTSIALTISNTEDLNKFLDNLTNYVLIFGSFTVITGVLYRIFLFIAQDLELQILIAFETYIEAYNNPPVIYVEREIMENNTYDEIIEFTEKDFSRKIQKLDISKLNPDQAKKARDNAINQYISINNLEKKLFEEEKESVKNVLMTHLGHSKKRVDKIFNDIPPKKIIRKAYWICLYISQILFVLSCLSFTSGMIVILIEYLIKLYC